MRSFSTKWLYSDIHREKGDDDVNDDVSSVLFFFFAFVIVARFLMSCVRLAGASLESLSSQSNGLDSANRRLDKPERYASKRFRWEFTTFRSRCRPVFVGQFFWRRVSSPRSSRVARRVFPRRRQWGRGATREGEESKRKKTRGNTTPMRKHTCPYHLTNQSDYQNLWISLIRGVFCVFSSVSFPHTRGVAIGVGIACKYTDARSSSQSAGGTRLFWKTREEGGGQQQHHQLQQLDTHARTHTPLDVYIHIWKMMTSKKKNLRTPSQRKLWEEHLKPDFIWYSFRDGWASCVYL